MGLLEKLDYVDLINYDADKELTEVCMIIYTIINLYILESRELQKCENRLHDSCDG